MKLLFILLSLSTVHLFAQENNSKHFSLPKNRYSIGLSDIARGNLLFYYERLIAPGASIQLGTGLTFDDLYALEKWEGEQYIERSAFKDTRFCLAAGLHFKPVPTADWLYMGVEAKFRQYYSADADFFHTHSGLWLGSNRKESVIKLNVGNFWYSQESHLLLDYSIGIGWLTSKDHWAYITWEDYPDHKYYSKNAVVQKPVIALDLKIGIGATGKEAKK